MNSEPIKNYFLDKLKKPGFGGLNGTELAFHIPVHVDFVNAAVAGFIIESEGLKDFKEVVFSEVENDKFQIHVNHKLIDKNIRCGFHPVMYNKHSEPLLAIEFLDGIKFYEKAILNGFGAFKKGWSKLKSVFKNDPDDSDTKSSLWEISGSKVVINFTALLDKQDLDYLNPMIQWDNISTRNDFFIIDFKIKT